MDPTQGIREAALQAHAVECLGRRRELQDRGEAGLRSLRGGCRAFDLAARQRGSAADGPRRQLALLRERRHHLGADTRKRRSIGADASIAARGARSDLLTATLLFAYKQIESDRMNTSWGIKVGRKRCRRKGDLR